MNPPSDGGGTRQAVSCSRPAPRSPPGKWQSLVRARRRAPRQSTYGLDDQACARGQTYELIIDAQLGELLLASAKHHESVQVAAVRLENRRLEAFDHALLLQAPVVGERLIEDLQALGLTPANRRTPPDKQPRRPPCSLLCVSHQASGSVGTRQSSRQPRSGRDGDHSSDPPLPRRRGPRSLSQSSVRRCPTHCRHWNTTTWGRRSCFRARSGRPRHAPARRPLRSSRRCRRLCLHLRGKQGSGPVRTGHGGCCVSVRACSEPGGELAIRRCPPPGDEPALPIVCWSFVHSGVG
jgi:hypothetical protein